MLLVNLCTTMSVSEFDAMKKIKENRTNQNCEQLSVKILKRLHGPAFDPRYMSISKPMDDEDNVMDPTDNIDRKRKTKNRPSFYITEEHTLVLSEEPAWNIEWDKFREEQSLSQTRKKRSVVPISLNTKATTDDETDTETIDTDLQRQKRQNSNQSRRSEPWRCEKKVTWVNLGPDYHPPHLRTIECTKPKCYYGMFDCKPRHFAVRILQRRRGACADAASLRVYGFTGQSAEVWEWVEISVNFCCDCVAPKNYY